MEPFYGALKSFFDDVFVVVGVTDGQGELVIGENEGIFCRGGGGTD